MMNALVGQQKPNFADRLAPIHGHRVRRHNCRKWLVVHDSASAGAWPELVSHARYARAAGTLPNAQSVRPSRAFC